jgi:hypothetical protein
VVRVMVIDALFWFMKLSCIFLTDMYNSVMFAP